MSHNQYPKNVCQQGMNAAESIRNILVDKIRQWPLKQNAIIGK